MNICHHMLTSSTQLQNRSFHVVERTRTSTKCQKMKNARAKRAKILFFIVNYANLSGFCCRRRRGCLRTFALIVCAQPFCAGNATVICHASLRLTGPEDKRGVEKAVEKNFRPTLLLWIIGDPYFFNHESLTLLTIYKI